jgi:hypothetical protein
MTKQKRQPRRSIGTHAPDEAPAGAALDRYEAAMMLMIASRVLDAYGDRDRSQQIDLKRQLHKADVAGDESE